MRPYPIVWDRAANATMWDIHGNEYVDFTSGVLVTNVGHSHPHVVAAIQEQGARLLNCFAAPHPTRMRAEQALLGLFEPPLERVFFFTTGAEAVEAAIKFARAFTGKRDVLAFHGAFHGRTALAAAVSGMHALKAVTGPLPSGVIHAPYPYCYRCPFGHADRDICPLHRADYLKWLLATESGGGLAAVLVEPYQGAGGCIVPPAGFLESLEQFCRARGALLIVDEIQSGFGRTGSAFAFEQSGIKPDIVCVGKGLGSGVPVSAVVTTTAIAESLPAGSMVSTYGGNPLACAAVIASIEVLMQENLAQRARRLGAVMAERLTQLRSLPRVGDVRTWGLVAGIEFVMDPVGKEPDGPTAGAVVREAAQRGLALIEPTGLFGNVVRVMPPLTIPDADLERGLAILRDCVEAVTTVASA